MNANVMITIIFINSFESIRHSNVGNTKSASEDPKIRVFSCVQDDVRAI